MAQIDAQLKRIVEGELKNEKTPLEFAAAHTELPIPKPLLILVPFVVLGCAMLSLATHSGLFAVVSVAIIAAMAVVSFAKHKNYLVVPTSTELVIVQVSQNLLRRIGTTRWHWADLAEVREYGSGTDLGVEIVPRSGDRMKLRFYTRLPKLSNGEERTARILEIIADRIGGQSLAAVVS